MTRGGGADLRIRAKAALALLELGRPDLRPARLPDLTEAQRRVAEAAAASRAPLVVVTGGQRAGASYLLRHLAITWAADHPGCQVLLTGPDELDLRRDHLEGGRGLPALLRQAADDDELLQISAPSSRARITTGSEIRWSAVPASGDLSQLLVARTDGVLIDDGDDLDADTLLRLVDAAEHGAGPPRRAVVVMRSAPGWLDERWRVVELGRADEGGNGGADLPEALAVPISEEDVADALHDLPDTPTGPDPGPRDADRAELEEIHARRVDGDLDAVLSPKRWQAMVDNERVRRQWERWRIHFTDDGRPRAAQEIARLRREEVERCRADVVYWALRYGVLQEPRGKEVVSLPWVLWPAQVEFLRYLLDCYRRGVDGNIIKAREVGASWGDRHVAWWLWWSVPGYSELVGTYEWELIDDGSTDSLFGMLRYIHAHQPSWMRPELDPVHHDKVAHFIHPEHGANIAGRRPKANFGRGRRRSRVVMDEAPYWQQKVQAKMRTALASTTECVMRQGTPASPGDEFHRRVKAARKSGEYSLFEMLWWADPRKTLEWYESLVPQHMTEEERARERDGEFVVISQAGIFKVSNAATYLVTATGERGLTYDDDDIASGRLHGLHSLEDLRRLPHVGMMDFGTGPSLTAYVGAAVVRPDDPDADPWIYFDTCMVWPKTPARAVAEDLKAAIIDSGRYGVHRYLGGDPAGKAAESDQESWEDRLQAAGWPITLLSPQANAAVEITQNLADWQRLMDLGRIRYHRQYAAILIRAVERWGWSVPEGEDPTDVNRANISPRKDKHSHPGDAARYVIYFATRYLKGRPPDKGRGKPIQPRGVAGSVGGGDPVADVMSKLRGGRW